ncbi:hypothetical protein HG530_008423 [Fusarium avenaceum]|nr:hypothetical protein HG530_008423 [Fusarium avenaceum]
MDRQLKRRGDFHDINDLSNFEFNDIYLEAISGSDKFHDLHIDGILESFEFIDDTDFKISTPRPAVDRKIKPSFLQPHIYNPDTSSWAPSSNQDKALRPGDDLKIASWNLLFSDHALAARTSAAIANLRTMFGEAPHNLVVMFQEVHEESLQVILGDKWVQENFVLSDTKPPSLRHANSKSFGKNRDPVRSQYFTLIMAPRDLPISNCFRVPFVSRMGRDALVVDIPVSEDPGSETSKKSLRLCTTLLESLSAKKRRFHQLAQVSALLKGDLFHGQMIYGGLVGGDMNSNDWHENGNHRAPEVDLKDVWEDEPAPKAPVLKPFQKDPTYGKARGNTWGYQSTNAKKRRRLDKFLYTGSIKTFALGEAQDTTGKLGRFGIGLKTTVGSDDIWVSDHFGITVGITVV